MKHENLLAVEWLDITLRSLLSLQFFNYLIPLQLILIALFWFLQIITLFLGGKAWLRTSISLIFTSRICHLCNWSPKSFSLNERYFVFCINILGRPVFTASDMKKFSALNVLQWHRAAKPESIAAQTTQSQKNYAREQIIQISKM